MKSETTDPSDSNHGTLFVVATPIGNRDDISVRARQVLTSVDLIAAEDTRHTGRLLSHFGVKTAQIALHDHNEEKVIGRVIDRLRSGSNVALVSDAGTPLISDPGYRLVQAAHAKNFRVSPIPGPSAVISAISAAGLPTDRFTFEGYLPAKHAARQTTLQNLRNEERTMIFLESVHRIQDSLTDLAAVFGTDRQAFLGRELTKLHEQCIQTNLGNLKQQVTNGDIVKKGEFVLVVHGAQADKTADPTIPIDALLAELMQSLPGKQAVDITTRLTNHPRKEIYRKMLKIKDRDQE